MNEQPKMDSPAMKFLDEAGDEQVQAAKAIVEVMKGSQTRRRADWAMDPKLTFICPRGHLQYNLPEEEIEEQRAKDPGYRPPPPVYEGAPCRQCASAVTRLTDDPKHLQQKLGTAMENVTMLQNQIETLRDVNADMNRIATFLRENYAWEIDNGQPQHDGAASKAVIHYLRIERSRIKVVRSRMWRAVLRMMGADR